MKSYQERTSSSFWDKIYQTGNSFFGEEPSKFALFCYNEYMKKNNVKKMLELGCGQGRDALFFASKGIEVSALDYSKVAIDGLIKLAKEKNLLSNIYPSVYDVKSMIPFKEGAFDTVFSHMFFSMRFTWEDLKFMFQEIRGVVKSNAFNFFSVRNHNDKSYGNGKKVDNDDVYEVNGFQIRFFEEQQVRSLVKDSGFEILDIKEVYEEPVTLYLVSTRKT
ncbi:MAG: class I SAM-dependent methyltransferase [Candidatus Nitrosopolaris sp.]